MRVLVGWLVVLLPSSAAADGSVNALGEAMMEVFLPAVEVLMPDLRIEILDDREAGLVVSFPLGWTLYDHDFGEPVVPETRHGASFFDVRHFVEPQVRVGPGLFYMGTGVRASAGRTWGGLLETGFFVGEPGVAGFVGGGWTLGPAAGRRTSFVLRRVFEEDAGRFDLCFDFSYHY